LAPEFIKPDAAFAALACFILSARRMNEATTKCLLKSQILPATAPAAAQRALVTPSPPRLHPRKARRKTPWP
jgi:hypothetical protein